MVPIAEVVKDREDVDVGVPIDNPFRIVVVDENFIDVVKRLLTLGQNGGNTIPSSAENSFWRIPSTINGVVR